jgi:hypothetical protein
MERRVWYLVLFLALWNTGFVAYNFVGLWLNKGELVVQETNLAVVIAELVLSILLTILLLGLFLGYAFTGRRKLLDKSR